MEKADLRYVFALLFGVFIAAVAQVLLKKSAMKQYSSTIKEYLNPLVIGGYTIFVGSTIMSILAYRGIPLSMGPILEATSYIYVTIFGVTIFHEKMNLRKYVALFLIMCGIAIYSLGVA
ncbi:DMT family transporter [Olegusella massiliensis]|uniref:multidrug ABC transporter n=1 Tax=Olegusella massiliensis TaxID=1776381 RepID=UPI0008381BF6|nr:multidrug ABC transporter [Olegusella massiliensis]MBS5865174.1 multidrug ABC transporter [Coriobacteriaceae bacterium]